MSVLVEDFNKLLIIQGQCVPHLEDLWVEDHEVWPFKSWIQHQLQMSSNHLHFIIPNLVLLLHCPLDHPRSHDISHF